ncbi:hypothetical protein OBBRIDRAFT_836941 [Obba rivulosa]|uniref:Arrestin-like N-terminal domain-containing protein n=1 Tax=Obba rivulosa TaxID=1052685 RepID=A0A8E2DIG8_9APHY|nr:hypothetical protein OBBRIDRAFT_836941 [Obba rivulosa]
MAAVTRPEPMNASPHHSKVKATLTLADPLVVAGGMVSGKLEVECKADKGLGVGIIMVELLAIEELTSKHHSATSTFLHSRRFFQGPGLPPSNAVESHTKAGDPPLPSGYHPARRGVTTFLFRFPLPSTSPASINLSSGLAVVKYEVKASVGVAWKGENRLVVDNKGFEVAESFEQDSPAGAEEGVIVGENGRIWVQGRVVGGIMVAGHPACIELHVKNLSAKKNTGIVVSLTRELQLPPLPSAQQPPLQILETLTSVTFRSAEYILHPGAEGVANLVVDVPRNARGVRGGMRYGDEDRAAGHNHLFQVQCVLGIALTMGLGSKDVRLDIPVRILHAAALSTVPPHYQAAYTQEYIPPQPIQAYLSPVSPQPYLSPTSPQPYLPPLSPSFPERALTPNLYPSPPISPIPLPQFSQGQIWLPPPNYQYPAPFALSPPPLDPYSYASTRLVAPYVPPMRPSSAEPTPSSTYGLPPLALPPQPLLSIPIVQGREVGQGERASRISHHLRLSSRGRSASPPAHRFATHAPAELIVHSAAALAPPEPSVQLVPSQPASGGASPAQSPRSRVSSFSLSPRLPPSPNLAPAVPRNSHAAAPTSAPPSPSLSPAVISPRPMLSPKHSFVAESFKQVKQLERLAAEEANAQSAPGTATADVTLRIDKTLPRMPADAEPDMATLLKGSTSLDVPGSKIRHLGGPLGGLDALEARLLAQVGTRKVENAERPPDVRQVLPIPIPPRMPDPCNDSAISSLSLPAADMDHLELEPDARTLRWGGASAPGSKDGSTSVKGASAPALEAGSSAGRRVSDTQRPGEELLKDGSTGKDGGSREKRYRGHKSGERTPKDEEIHRIRQEARGRVAQWLGSVEPALAPPTISTPPLPVDNVSRTQPISALEVEPKSELREVDISAPPNLRSSGFVPVGTYRASQLQPPRGSSNANSSPSRLAAKLSLASPTTEMRPSARIASATTLAPAPKNVAPELPVKPMRLTVFPSQAGPLDTEVKYDVRSARGGRGGRVMAVAALWANAVGAEPKQGKDETENVKAPTKPSTITASAKLGVANGSVPPKPSPTVAKAKLQLEQQSKAAAPVPAAPELSAPAPKPVSPSTPKATASPTRKSAPSLAPKPPAFSAKPVGSLKPALAPKPAAARKPSPVPKPPLATKPSPGAASVALKRARLVKAASVPAIVSSSLATPVLSSTASLARPISAPRAVSAAPAANGRALNGALEASGRPTSARPPRIDEEPAAPGSRNLRLTAPVVKAPRAELAFGQARLRELIKKYQGAADA